MSEIEKNRDFVNRIAAAARLSLSAEECERLGADVEKELTDLSETFFEPFPECRQDRAVGLDALREDCAGDCVNREDLLVQAAFHDETYFLVPRVLGGEGETS